jgi:hypothetical protein
MSPTAVGEITVLEPRIGAEVNPTQTYDAPTQIHVLTASGAEYYIDYKTHTVLSRPDKNGLFTYAELDEAGIPTLEIGQLFSPTTAYGVGNRIVALALRKDHQEHAPDDPEDTLLRMKPTHAHARFLLDLAASKSHAD